MLLVLATTTTATCCFCRFLPCCCFCCCLSPCCCCCCLLTPPPLLLPSPPSCQARVLLRLNRPVDVAERGLVFVQNFLSLLAVKEAAGQVKPWFKEVGGFGGSVSV